MENYSAKTIDVTGIGNPIVDIISQIEDESIFTKFGLEKGVMNTLNSKQAEEIHKYLIKLKDDSRKVLSLLTSNLTPELPCTHMKEISGGTAANTVVGVSALGGNGGFIGNVKDDFFGNKFITKLEGRNIETIINKRSNGSGTPVCFVLVTQDINRTLCTYMGSASGVDKEDIDDTLIAKSKIIFLTGYLWDNDQSEQAAIKAIELAKKHNCKIAFTLADVNCTARHKRTFLDLLNNDINIFFGNKDEVNCLLDSNSQEASATQLEIDYKDKDFTAFLTCGKNGVIVVRKGKSAIIPPTRVEDIVDKTGVGSLFAAGALYAITRDIPLEKAAQLGNMAAAEGLKIMGARPTTNLSPLVKKIL